MFKQLKQGKRIILLILALLPFLFWFFVAFYSNFYYTAVTFKEIDMSFVVLFLFGTIVYFLLCLYTPIKEKKAKIIVSITLAIIDCYLIYEGLGNDKFHMIYPFLIGGFTLYYAVLNLMSWKMK